MYKQLYQRIPNPFKAGRFQSVSENQTTDPNSKNNLKPFCCLPTQAANVQILISDFNAVPSE